MKRRVLVATGSRAEYFLLRPLLRKLQASSDFDLQLAVTGSHLEKALGYTYSDIEKDGFHAEALVDLHRQGDDATAIAAATARAVEGFSQAYQRLQPELLVVLGDRYEIFAAAAAALFHRLPVAHIAGGDVTEGAFDESLRHSISKMAHIHFPTNEQSRERLLKMGEKAENVHNVGSLSLDLIAESPRLSRQELTAKLGIEFQKHTFLITVHPETLAGDSLPLLEALLSALESDHADSAMVFTMANADPQGQALNRRIEKFVAGKKNAILRPSLGASVYLSMMREADAVLGNSSSGIYEAPALGVPTVNIGNRQKGRLFANSVFSCEGQAEAVRSAIRQALAFQRGQAVSPYGTPGVAERMIGALSATKDFRALVAKGFHE